MPVASHQVIQPKEDQKLSLRLEPAQTVFCDLFLLDKAEKLSGVDRWVERTVEQLSEQRLHQNHHVLNGLYYALMPRRSYPDFESYLDDLADQDPAEWIDNLLETYNSMSKPGAELTAVERDELLADFDAYLDFLYQRFDSKHIEIEVERQAHQWLANPEQMQRQALEHLRFMWQEHLEPAWNQALPLIEDSLRSFNQADWPEGSELEVAQWVTGQALNDFEQAMLAEAERVVFVPSAHVGPYLISLMPQETLWLVFGARAPAGAPLQSAALSRSQLLMRLNALADDNRLHILDLLREHGEMCAQEIMEAIELSQSSVSRHLRQLSATGYVLERRRDSAKCYRLNPDQTSETVMALADFLEVEC